jgi:hypothetical protein
MPKHARHVAFLYTCHHLSDTFFGELHCE